MVQFMLYFDALISTLENMNNIDWRPSFTFDFPLNYKPTSNGACLLTSKSGGQC